MKPKQPEDVKAYLDIDNLRERFSGRPRLLSVMKQEFVAMQQNLVPELQSAHEEGNQQAMKELAHTLKGNAALVGAFKVMDLAARIEASTDGGHWQHVGRDLEQIPPVMQQTVEYLEWFLENSDSCLEQK
jgi:HPt (histidine-containing phosphotransfer) domain-containing protein